MVNISTDNASRRMRNFLNKVNSGAITDDANLGAEEADTARLAYRFGLVNVVAVGRRLSMTDAGREYLGTPQPHPVIEARDHGGMSIDCINGLKGKLERSQARETRAVKALRTLVYTYIANRGGHHEFVRCITPENVPDHWRTAMAIAVLAGEGDNELGT